ncbi:uncharacterized protein ACHE_31417S [Aspergillus chevalieri]|nr:uncharacterized protein ACHE_31417S [Aspergillus chevalieri]BCR87430.1 hypothetical protein ACHE_31417S [Aspergillus chevalieri]
MAQMLVAQRAVQMADHGQVEHPADALEAMRERFLLPGVAAPFNWLTRAAHVWQAHPEHHHQSGIYLLER